MVALLAVPAVRRFLHPLALVFSGKQTVEQRVSEFEAARGRVRAKFAAAGLNYPPARAVLLGLKQEKRIELYAGSTHGDFVLIETFPILAASGTLGPKLVEGDRQVPEGVYGVESLNPNSRFHVSLRVDYPNELDRTIARDQGRTRLGGDIMIHGGAASVGCLAIGDPAAEEVFVLAAETGVENVKIVLSPVDLRRKPLPAVPEGHQSRYAALQSALDSLPRIDQ